jgi:hypothetical protein
MIDIVARLISQTHALVAAEAYRSFTPDRAKLNALATAGLEVLRQFPPLRGPCVLMSAMWAARWQLLERTPVYVVAGALLIGSERVFGDENTPFDGRTIFSESNPSWNGHCWLVFGNYLADISIFSTAYSAYTSLVLAQHMVERFGRGHGLLLSTADNADRAGLHYRPQYVLTDDQIAELCVGARSIIEKPGSDQFEARVVRS